MLAASYPRIHALPNCLPTRHPPRTLEPITHTLHTRCTSRIRTNLGKIKARNHSLGNGHTDALGNQVVDRHHHDTFYTTGLEVSIRTRTWPNMLIPQTQGVPTAFQYNNLKIDALKYNIKQTHISLSSITNYGALFACAASNGARISRSTKHTPHSPISNSRTSMNSCG
jgi:hypothetical protein